MGHHPRIETVPRIGDAMTNYAPAPEAGDFVGWVVGMPGPDIDYALCIRREGENAVLLFQVYQQPGPWIETTCGVTSETRIYGCWKTSRINDIGPALRAKRRELFPDLQETPE